MYRINDRKMYYDMADGQAVVINFETGMYYGMSSLGSAVLDLLLKGSDPTDLAAVLEKVPSCPGDIKERIQAFIQDLMDKEILMDSAEKGSFSVAASSVEFGREAFDDGFQLDLNEYAEAQDLILADPIHDVDVNMGWPIMKGSGSDANM